MSDNPYQCINCNRLGHCTETSADKVMAGYHCDRWEEATQEVYAARVHVIQLFGKSGIQAAITKDLKEED